MTSGRQPIEPAPEAAPPFDEAYARLREIVDRLENGSLGLEESLAEFEAGIGLLRTCTRILEGAERRIEMLTGFDARGRPTTRPFDATATHDPQPATAAGEESGDEPTDEPATAEGEPAGRVTAGEVRPPSARELFG